MKKYGIVLELRENEVIVFNNNGEYDKIERVNGMFKGQLVKYDKSQTDAVKRYIITFSSIAAVFALILISCFLLFHNSNSQISAYISLDINPSMEFSIDDRNNIKEIHSLNPDTEKIIKPLNIKGLEINKAISYIIAQLKKSGYLLPEKENLILISASSNNPKSESDTNHYRLNKIINSIKATISDETSDSTKIMAIYASPEIRKASVKYNMSIGRYALYSKAVEQGSRITPQEAKTTPLNKLIVYLNDGSKAKTSSNIEIIGSNPSISNGNAQGSTKAGHSTSGKDVKSSKNTSENQTIKPEQIIRETEIPNEIESAENIIPTVTTLPISAVIPTPTIIPTVTLIPIATTIPEATITPAANSVYPDSSITNTSTAASGNNSGVVTPIPSMNDYNKQTISPEVTPSGGTREFPSGLPKRPDPNHGYGPRDGNRDIPTNHPGRLEQGQWPNNRNGPNGPPWIPAATSARQ